MRIERLSESKIKFTVTYEDMEKWGISIESFIEDTPKARELFKVLIEKAETETGFRAGNSRLMIEAQPGKYDEIVLFVTNLDIQEGRNKKGKLRAKAIMPDPDVFKFEKFDDLCDFVKNCTHKNYGGAVYLLDDVYYLVSDEVNARIVEYGKPVYTGGITSAYLKEHGKCIIEKDAICTIEKYF